MHIILFFSFLFIPFCSPSKAIVLTDTHAYIVSAHHRAVLAINRQTGEETNIPVGAEPQSMVIHKQKGYVPNYHSASITVIDLKTQKSIKTLSVGKNPVFIHPYEDKGYIVSMDSEFITVIDLISDEVSKTIHIGDGHKEMQILDDKGYVLVFASSETLVIDLKTDTVIKRESICNLPVSLGTFEHKRYMQDFLPDMLTAHPLENHDVLQSLPLPEKLSYVVIHKEKGYIHSINSTKVYVVDLKTLMITNAIYVGPHVTYMNIYKDKGYLGSEGSPKITVINLLSDKIITLNIGYQHKSFLIQNGFGYIEDSKLHCLFIVNLDTDEVVATVENPKNEPIESCPPYIYFHFRKAALYFSTSQEVETYIQEKLKSLPINSYTDLLSPQEIKELFLQTCPGLAFEFLFALYQPQVFLNTPEGQAFCASLARSVYQL